MNWSEMTQLTEHFSREEMQCPCCKACEMNGYFMDQLEMIRGMFHFPMRINSGYRCQKHNDSLLNSSPNSWHTKGKAADISWDEFDAKTKHRLLEKSIRYFEGIGIGKSYLHVDLGGEEKVWVY
jgi:zinc D-Ala-D-Ala carboxypeptidase